MHILVSDTSILIDLERAGLEDVLLQLGHQWVVPDLLYATEIEHWTGPQWLQRGLQVLDLTPEEAQSAQDRLQRNRALSLNDCFALALAQGRGWILLTSDAALRKLAAAETVTCHGFLWLIQLAADSGADIVSLEQGVRRLLSHPRCRLPRADTEALLKRLRGG